MVTSTTLGTHLCAAAVGTAVGIPAGLCAAWLIGAAMLRRLDRGYKHARR